MQFGICTHLNSKISTPPTYDELVAMVATLQQQLAGALAKIVELEARLGKNSGSHKGLVGDRSR